MPNPKLQTYKNKATNTVYDLTDADAQNKLTAILDGTNIDSFGDVETAVSALQPKNLSHSIAGESTVEGALDAIAAGGGGVTVDNVKANTQLIADTVGWSGKNKLPITLAQLKANNTTGTWSGNVYTYGGATYTVETDGNYVTGITVNSSGVTTSHNFSIIQKAQLEYLLNDIGKTFTLSGCPSGGSDSTYRLTELSLTGVDTATLSDYGNGVNFTVGDFSSFENDAYIVIRVFSGATISNKVFKPMLRDANILDSTYEPYRNTTAFPRDEQAVLGAKNLFDGTKGVADNGGLSVTVNNDGSVTVPSGTPSSYVVFPNSSTYEKVYKVEPNTKYIFSIGYKASNVYLSVNYKATSGDSWHAIFEVNNVDEYEFTTPSTIYTLWIRFTISQNVAFGGATFYPMLRLATDPDSTYAPYAMTNEELTKKKYPRGKELSSSDNLNNITEDGIYFFSTHPTNGPEAITNGTLIVNKGASGYINQMVISTARMYTRSYNPEPGQGWYSWYAYIGTSS